MKLKNILYVTLIVTLTSCGDFLEPKSQSEYVPKDANALQEMLIGEAYPKHSLGNRLLSYLEIFNDDIQQQELEGYDFPVNAQSDVEPIGAMFTWQSDMFTIMEQRDYNGINNVWEGTYEFILGTNAALDYIDDVSGTEAEKNYVIAQALGLRAFYYYILVNYYGAPYNYDKNALGVPLKLDSGLKEESELFMTRNTVDQVYTQIIKDLNEAERLFLTLPIDRQYQPNYLVSLPMVELLKSRVYLYMENWPEAKKYANKVITDWKFSLLDLNNITLPDPTAREPYYEFTSYQSPEVIWLYGSIADFTSQYTNYISRGENTNDNRKAFIASDALLSSFKTGDLRKELYIVKEMNVNTSNPSLNTFYDTYLPFGKYKTSNSAPVSSGIFFALSFRLSEAYLNFAEASALDNAEGEAISAMNTLLEKRYTPETYTAMTGLTGEALVNAIREERRKELCYEGQRWFDLRRYGMPSFTRKWQGHTYTLTEKDRSYTMPLLKEIIDKNRRLEQNPLAPKRMN